ncbi:MAG: iron-containing alcohol dehydrogenase [Limisphaerales bacterium]|nr:MAG: iron-containing alcohol dehydrogenase [Limisphaerales bacterium]
MSHHPAELAEQASFDAQLHLRLVFGNGTLDRLGELAREHGAGKVLLVTDPGIRAVGHVDRAQASLAAAELPVVIYDQAKENPTTECVAECVEMARRKGIDFIVGLGGGSSMDTAKGCNFLLTNGGEMKDYWGVGKASKPMLPIIAIPTTAGTGSECQSFALISDAVTHAKMACGDPKAMAKVAILDPELTLSQPPRVTACTGIDAVAHAVESAVTRKRNETSQQYSRVAFSLLSQSLPTVLAHPDNVQARGRMLLGAAFAGTAIEHSMLGAAHSAANPLTAHFGVIHGQAVGLMLPHVVRFNGEDETVATAYAELVAGTAAASNNGVPAHESLAAALEGFMDAAGMPRNLAACGVDEGKVNVLSEEAAGQWTASFNPRDITAADFEGLYSRAFDF